MADDPRAAAIDRLKAKRDFKANVGMFVIINLFLIGIWAVTGAGFFWPIFVIGGWGIGLVAHAWTVFGQKPITEDDVQREMGKGDGDVA